MVTYNTRSEVPVLANDLYELLIGLLTSTIGIDIDRQRFCNTDSVRKLDKSTSGKTGSNQRLS